MASYSDLVEVTFQDMTSHQSTDGKDVLGIFMPFHWGPVDKLKIYNKTAFFEAYPESLPVGKSLSDASAHYYDAYAQVKKFFDNGGAFVEVYRPLLGNKWQGVTQGDYKVALKYPGSIPASLLPLGTTGCKLEVTETSVKLLAVNGTVETVIESWKGQFTDVLATEDGRYTHFIKVLEGSQFLTCFEASDLRAFEEIKSGTVGSTLDSSDVLDVDGSVIEGIFSDIESSDATLVISPVTTAEFDQNIANISRTTKVSCAVVGYPPTEEWDSEAIEEHFQSFTDKFTLPLAGREVIQLFGTSLLSNCVGGYCGALANIANSVRINQIASAKTYGTYVGVLDKSLSFADVLDLHESGITSVYSSKTGPQLFGVHNASYKQSPQSYFSKSNVSRVVSNILKNIFPICFEVLHTDAAANPISRAIFESRCNSVIYDMIARQNLQSDSRAVASADINTDYLTKGGRELNLVLVLHFIGLVEKVKIKVVATDSSVNAEII